MPRSSPASRPSSSSIRKALKGPAAKIMLELGITASPLSIARFYDELIDGIVVDAVDRNAVPSDAYPVPVLWANTVMRGAEAMIYAAMGSLLVRRITH